MSKRRAAFVTGLAALTRPLGFLALIALSCPCPKVLAQTDLMRPLSHLGKYTFNPNQNAGVEWMHPGAKVINGHFETSFADTTRWPRLHDFLEKNHGLFGVNAAEIGHMTSDELSRLRRAGIAISTPMPGPTQCIPGLDLAKAEIFGTPYGSRDIFKSNFHITSGEARAMPEGHGWFVTKDGDDYAPDEIVLDHRMDTMEPKYSIRVLTDPNSSLSWADRKAQARKDTCPAADRFPPGGDRIDNVINDYIAYDQTLKARYPAKAPAFSIWWGLSPAGEWRDEACMDALVERYQGNFTQVDRALRLLTSPCQRETQILSRLLDKMCAKKLCPHTVYMDMDLTYNTAYSLDIAKKYKAVLQAHNVGFGIGLADESDERPHCVMVQVGPSQIKLKTVTGESENALHQTSLLNKMRLLVENGVVDGDTRIRFQSWSIRPIETGPEVGEDVPNSIANTVDKVVDTYLVPNGWAAR